MIETKFGTGHDCPHERNDFRVNIHFAIAVVGLACQETGCHLQFVLVRVSSQDRFERQGYFLFDVARLRELLDQLRIMQRLIECRVVCQVKSLRWVGRWLFGKYVREFITKLCE